MYACVNFCTTHMLDDLFIMGDSLGMSHQCMYNEAVDEM